MTAFVSSLPCRGFTAGGSALGRLCGSRYHWLTHSWPAPVRTVFNEFLGFVDSVVSLAF